MYSMTEVFTLESLRTKEQLTRIPKSSNVYEVLFPTCYMKNYRRVICEWFIDIQNDISLDQRTVHVATFYLDICMFKLYSTNNVYEPANQMRGPSTASKFDPRRSLQLLGACCMWIAAKRDETCGDSKLTLNHLVRYCRDIYTKQQFLQMELYALELLDWGLEDVSCVDFLNVILLANNNTLDNLVIDYAKEILNATLLCTLTRPHPNLFERLNSLFGTQSVNSNLSHTYASLWMTMLNYPSLMAICSLLTAFFVCHFNFNAYEQGQEQGPIVNSIDQFGDVIANYYHEEMEKAFGFTLEQVILCCRILYIFLEQTLAAHPVAIQQTTQQQTSINQNQTFGEDPDDLQCDEDVN
ncbi:hypothetical protein ABK040_004715 [Willaertia magna]